MRFLHDPGFVDAVLWVHPDSQRARDFYAHLGWTDDGIDMQAEVMGVTVQETRYSLHLASGG